MRVLFWVCLLGAMYSYFLYPLLLCLFPKRVRSPAGSGTGNELPLMSFIITAHNEESLIEEKLKNTLALDYPIERLEVLVASDASTDDTDDIVRSYKTKGVRLVRADKHFGKEYAQSLAVKAANGEILVFSDAATEVPQDALRNLANAFSDPSVGAVSSVDRFVTDSGRIVGEGLYVRYEMWLRGLESRLAGLIGLSGSFFAARKSVCENWDIVSPSDFNTALNCARKGFVAISSPAVVGIYKDIKDERREYKRKVRTVVRGMTAIARQPSVLNPFHFGFFAFEVWSHKLMRWAVPWFLVGLLMASIALVGRHWFFTFALAGQVAVYIVVAAAWMSPTVRHNALARLAFFFIQVNFAITHATLAFLSGKRITTWKPSER